MGRSADGGRVNPIQGLTRRPTADRLGSISTRRSAGPRQKEFDMPWIRWSATLADHRSKAGGPARGTRHPAADADPLIRIPAPSPDAGWTHPAPRPEAGVRNP
jgi:hypothetical protein